MIMQFELGSAGQFWSHSWPQPPGESTGIQWTRRPIPQVWGSAEADPAAMPWNDQPRAQALVKLLCLVSSADVSLAKPHRHHQSQ